MRMSVVFLGLFVIGLAALVSHDSPRTGFLLLALVGVLMLLIAVREERSQWR